MADSAGVTPEGEAHSTVELLASSNDDHRRNPQLALLLKSIAWFCGITGFLFPGLILMILRVNETPEWAMIVTVTLLGIATLAGARSSYYNKAPREERFQQELNLAKKNLAATNRLITLLNEEFNEQVAEFEEIKRRIDDKKRAEQYDPGDAPSLVRLITAEMRAEDRRDDRRRWARDVLLLVAGFVLGVVGNWVASPLLTMFSW